MADTSTTTDYAEKWLEAMDVLINKRIESIHFDQTIDATITDDSKADKGEYTVSTGHAAFVAYSTETKYRVNDQVMVTIPQGDYDNQKMIIGKRVDNNNSPLIYQSPFQRIIDVTNNLINVDLGTTSFWANCSDIEQGRPWDTDASSFRDADVYTGTVEKSNLGCIWDSGPIYYEKLTYLGIKAQFSSWLNEYATAAGNYGLAVEITFKNTDIPTLSEDDKKEHPDQEQIPNTFTNIVVFDSDEFFGDVYNFETFFTQENVYDLTDFADFAITKLRLFAYQRNNFVSRFGDPIYETIGQTQFSTFPPNLFIKDAYICLGVERASFQEDTATLMSESTSTYYKGAITADEAAIAQRNEANRKTIALRWIHKDVEKNIIKAVEPDEFPADYEVRWYRHQNGAKSPDEFAGAHWVRFYGCHPKPHSDTEDWAILESELPKPPPEDGSLPSEGTITAEDIATNQLEIVFYPNVNYQSEMLKAIVLKNEGGTVYRRIAQSLPIEFVNDDEVSSKVTIIDENALSIRFNDDCKGFYFIYNRAGTVGRQEDANILRTLTAVFGPEPNIYEKNPLEQPYNSIEWIFPESNDQTMIIPADSVEAGAKPLKWDAAAAEGRPPTIEGAIEVGYFIKPRLNRNAINNTISLKINKGGVDYTAEVQMSFGTAGSSGSDYTLDVRWDNGENALDLSKKIPDNEDGVSILSGRAYLLDQNHQLVDFQTADSGFEFSWYKVYDPNDKGTVTVLKPAEPNMRYPIRGTGVGLTELSFVDSNTNDLQIANYLINDYADSVSATDREYSYYDFIYRKRFIDKNTLGENIQSLAEIPESSPCAYRRDPNPYSEENPRTAIDFIPINYVEYGNVDSENEGKLKYNSTEKTWTYYYSSTAKAFIKHNDTYIIDPWGIYSEVETYYFPVKTSETVVVSSETALKIVTGSDNNFARDGKFSLKGNPDINSLYILEVKVVNFGDYDIISRIPVPIKTGDYITVNGDKRQDTFVVDYINGATNVRYASSGETDFDKMPYQIFTRTYISTDTGSNTFIQKNQLGPGDDNFGYWCLIYDPGSLTEVNQTFIPSLSEHDSENNTIHTSYIPGPPDENGFEFRAPTLIPPGVYFSETPIYGVQFRQTRGWDLDGNESTLDRPIWTQPIYSFQDNYPSTTLNKWNGKDIQTEEDTGTIIANGLAAGKKERDNTFTGVVLGDWSRTDTDAFITKQTGVYGFNHGAMSYALKDDGTAFFGKDGSGRIYLAGDKAQIYSANWKIDRQGMLLDVDDGYVKMTKKGGYALYSASDLREHFEERKEEKPCLFYYKQVFQHVDDKSQADSYVYQFSPNSFEKTNVDIWYNDYIWYLWSEQHLTDDELPETEKFTDQSLSGAKKRLTDQANQEYIELDENLRQGFITLLDSGNAEYTNNVTSCTIDKRYIAFNNNKIELVSSSDIQVDVLIKDEQISTFFYKEIFPEDGDISQVAYKFFVKKSHTQQIYVYYNKVVFENAGVDLTSIPIKRAIGWAALPEGTSAFSDSKDFYFKHISEPTKQYIQINTLTSYDPGISYYKKDASSSFDRYITLSAVEDDYPLAIGQDEKVQERKFKVNWEGKLYSVDGNFSGKINSSEGYIGGWAITQDRLSAQDNDQVYFDSKQGLLHGARIETNSGLIGGWEITDKTLQGGDTVLHSDKGIFTNNINIKETGSGPGYNDYFGGMGYVSAKFTIDPDKTEEQPGVALYYGRSSKSSNAIYKVNSYNLGFKWNGAWMSLNRGDGLEMDAPPTEGIKGKKWTFDGNKNTDFYIQNMKNINIGTCSDLAHPEDTATYSVDTVYINAKQIKFNTPKPDNQTGIYARFA